MSARAIAPLDQAVFAAALLDAERPCPPGLCAWNGSDPARRFAVYRNTIVSGLVDALADSFPVVAQLVGDVFFRAMAAVHVRQSPPRSPVLAIWGGDFPDFIASFPPAARLPYLADVARLEHARLRACHAADAAPITDAELRDAMTDAQALATATIVWHPSMQIVASPFAVVSLWSAHQGDGDVPPVAIDAAEHALVLRDGLEVLVLPVGAGAAAFVAAGLAGADFGAAVAEAAVRDPAFDLAATLSRLLAHGALQTLRARSTLPGCPA